MRDKNLLKKLAEKAKNRMLGKSENSKNIACIKIIRVEEDEFNARAKDVIISSEKDQSFNPIKMLMDENALMKLDERGREKYLLDTVVKYLRAKKLFEMENCLG